MGNFDFWQKWLVFIGIVMMVNGQNISSKNPSYDAHGFALRFTSLF